MAATRVLFYNYNTCASLWLQHICDIYSFSIIHVVYVIVSNKLCDDFRLELRGRFRLELRGGFRLQLCILWLISHVLFLKCSYNMCVILYGYMWAILCHTCTVFCDYIYIYIRPTVDGDDT